MATIYYNATNGIDDLVLSNTGTDTYIVHLNNGNDILSISGNHKVYGDAGEDTIWIPTGVSFVDGGIGNDVLLGGSGDGSYYGGEGNDMLYGGSGNERLDGGDGDDTINGGSGNDRIWTGSGTNTVNGGAGDDQIQLAGGQDLLEFVDNFGTDRIKFSGEGQVLMHIHDNASGFVRLEGLTGFDGKSGLIVDHAMYGTVIHNAAGDMMVFDTDPTEGYSEFIIQYIGLHIPTD